MGRESMYSKLDRFVSSLVPELVCNHKSICPRRNICKRKDFSESNSVSFVAMPNGKWDNCEYFVV